MLMNADIALITLITLITSLQHLFLYADLSIFFIGLHLRKPIIVRKKISVISVISAFISVSKK